MANRSKSKLNRIRHNLEAFGTATQRKAAKDARIKREKRQAEKKVAHQAKQRAKAKGLSLSVDVSKHGKFDVDHSRTLLGNLDTNDK